MKQNKHTGDRAERPVNIGEYQDTQRTIADGEYSSEQCDEKGNKRVSIQGGDVAHDGADSGNPVKVGGKYNATPPTIDDGDRGDLQLDESANIKNRESYAPKYEDNTNEVAKVEQRFSYENIVLAAPTTTVVKSSAGFLHSITFNKPATTGVVTIYDNTAGSGTKIGTITTGGNVRRITLLYDVAFATGLTIVTSVAAQDITVSYR